ncbi:MAG TPA: hypothetical protein VNY83_04910 [Solirubrobacterales bacterium]|nr:hypothetical protein [Solirubrobacterales bacterium]
MTTATPIPERLKALETLTIYQGAHTAPYDDKPKGCTNELISWVCGLPWSATPSCVDKRLSDLIIGITDNLENDEVRTAHMRKVVPLAINTAGRKEEITAMLDRLAVKRLREAVLPLAETWPEGIRDQVRDAVEGVAVAIAGNGDRDVAESAAESAESAAESAARSARSAWSARSARSAARSARSAESAWSAEADRLIFELEALA